MSALPRLALLLAAFTGPSDDLPARGEVAVDVLKVYDAPEPAALCSGRLPRGASVMIRSAGPDGWLAVDPPPHAFDWIEQDAIEIEPDGIDAVVTHPTAVLRSAPLGARVPGAAVGQRNKGDRVRLLDPAPSPPASPRPLRAIVPPAGEVRYVRADGVRREKPKPPQEIQAAYFPQAAPGAKSDELAQTESMHRAIVRGPMEEWRLEPIKARYKALLDQSPDSATAGVLRDRLAVVARQEEMARDAQAFEAILQRSRLRDRSLAGVRRQLAQVKPAERRNYDAEGLIQPSARKVEGEKVLALIGADGFAVAYLRVPPGLDTRPFLTRKVGVRGDVHYDEHLRARVIAVSDMEPLERSR